MLGIVTRGPRLAATALAICPGRRDPGGELGAWKGMGGNLDPCSPPSKAAPVCCQIEAARLGVQKGFRGHASRRRWRPGKKDSSPSLHPGSNTAPAPGGCPGTATSRRGVGFLGGDSRWPGQRPPMRPRAMTCSSPSPILGPGHDLPRPGRLPTGLRSSSSLGLQVEIRGREDGLGMRSGAVSRCPATFPARRTSPAT
jgi:hypothetical protein